MTDIITVTGVVGTDPKHHVTNGGLAITTFRLASTRRVFDRAKGTWEDGETNWYTVSAFRQLATNASLSIRKGERLIIRGRLRLRAWETGERSGTAVEIEADSIGHDLAWCVTSYAKVRSTRPADAAATGSSEAAAGEAFEAPQAGSEGTIDDGTSAWPDMSTAPAIGFDADSDVGGVDGVADDVDDVALPELESTFAG
ncbi:single-stranded DNA-binding protein [Agromyces cerinus]|uniref:Single-stranded DNA-binding protein n=1 Tax=Agromyces cerinus subsp. cerinus TaxID=232089 RepID=A0A1N6DQJ5_9MICO|nr:single-stranded DNA-binding protein [Agromyces cerinus]SIN73072.1 single-strand DNA-binding protein [Agromyces cerinus subsp. cerinus]